MTRERQQGEIIGATVAFAAGDAPGWPVEPRGNRVGGTRELRPEPVFRAWTRREGGRYAPHEEQMPPGVYSDDTQLTLAVARSLRHPDWWEHFTRVELPWWPHYELGGGGALRRAAQAWAKRKVPWGADGASGYWTAGGNGAAMGVLPPCTPQLPFATIRQEVLANGAATHGDPIALVGAQLYAYALWMMFQRVEPLGWGQLLDEALESTDDWAQLDPTGVPGDWADHLPGDYVERWART